MKKLFGLSLFFSIFLLNLNSYQTQSIYAMDKESTGAYLQSSNNTPITNSYITKSYKQNVENNTVKMPDNIISTDTQSPYNVYISDIEPTAKNTYKYQANLDSSSQPFSLNKNGQTVYYEKALLVQPKNNSYSSIYYTDIQEKGYTSFVADYGVDTKFKNTNASVKFKVYVDGKIAFESGIVNGSTSAGKVEISLEDAQVLQLVVESEGSNANDNAIWANAHFTRENYTPYLEVYDLEFNLPSQVTKSNIMEYVTAYDDDGVDLTESITYETNYNGEKQGEFYVTYSVKDKSGNVHTRTVKLTVTGEDYTKPLTIERLKKPWATYLYHGRGTLSTQGKKAWDLLLKEVLDFDASKWNLINRWNENVYPIQIDLQANNIFVKKSEISSLGYMFMDDEPRTFILKDWNCDITEKDGLAHKVTIWAIANAVNQDQTLNKIENNTIEMLKEYKEDMSDAQALYAVSMKYKNWVKYEGINNSTQYLSNSLGEGKAVCGGNARGYIYLSQRLGIKSVWGRSGSHAWSFTKLADIDYWFNTDLLADQFLTPGVNGETNLSVGGNFKSRHYEWFTFGTQAYPQGMLKYPSVWVDLSTDVGVISPNEEYNLLDFVSDYGSIYNEEFLKDDITVKIDKLDENCNVISENLTDFPISSEDIKPSPGYYQVIYTIEDNGKTNSSKLFLRVSDGDKERYFYDDKVSAGAKSGVQNPLGLWTGSEEKWYDNGVYLNDGSSITFNIEEKGYRYLSFDFGIKDSVRRNTSWGHNGKVAAKVTAETDYGTVVLYVGNVLNWYSEYESIFLLLPETTKTVTITALDKGSGNGHGGIGNLSFIKDSGTISVFPSKNPPKLSKTELTVTETDDVNLFTVLKGVDNQDGEFVLNENNFIIDNIAIEDGKIVAGVQNLKYQLKDTDNNIKLGEFVLNVVKFFNLEFIDPEMNKVETVVVNNLEKFVPPTPTREGYKFLGWYVDDVLYDFSKGINQDMQLVAKWEKIETITSTTEARKELKKVVEYANTITIEMVGATSHKEKRWENFTKELENAKSLLLDTNSTDEQISTCNAMLQYFISELYIK